MYRYKIIKTTAKTDEIPYTEKSFSLYWEESRKLTPTVKDLLFLGKWSYTNGNDVELVS